MEVLVLPVLALLTRFVSFSSPHVTGRATLLFVAGFAVVATMGITATILGSLFLRNEGGIVRVYATGPKGASREVSVTNDGGR
ncbi:MAG: hypothetical protein KY447_10645 [Actinobacteria bacterium]|nr:hypothetical protein [Actinomycetota bacterium]